MKIYTDPLAANGKSRILIIGGEDVDARIEIMQRLSDEFHLAAAGSASDLAQRFDDNGFSFFYYPLSRGNAPIHDIRTMGSLVRLLRKYRPRLVHSFDSKPCVYARLAARIARIPIIVGTIPGLGSLYVENGRKRRLVRSVYEKLQTWASHSSDLTIFQNHDDAREFVDRGVVPESKQMVIPGSGVRTDLYDPAAISQSDRDNVRVELGLPLDSVVITMVTRVIPAKGVEEFIAASRQISEIRPDVRFLLVGPGDSNSVECYSGEQLKTIKESVNWPGARRDIPQILAASDIFVLPSFYREGIPRSLLEAASMGLPLVTTNSPGCKEVVEDGINGFLVPVRDADALSQALQKLVANAGLRRQFGQASRRFAVTKFDLEKVAEQTRTIYRNLLKSSNDKGDL